jgi:hypothetical protein
VTVIQILDELRSRGVRVEPRPHGKLWLTPARAVDSVLLEKVRAAKPALLQILAPEPERVIEATFSAVTATGRDRAINGEFPPCPNCKMARYWITPGGKVVCGKCGEVRFLLTNIAYHAVN